MAHLIFLYYNVITFDQSILDYSKNYSSIQRLVKKLGFTKMLPFIHIHTDSHICAWASQFTVLKTNWKYLILYITLGGCLLLLVKSILKHVGQNPLYPRTELVCWIICWSVLVSWVSSVIFFPVKHEAVGAIADEKKTKCYLIYLDYVCYQTKNIYIFYDKNKY